MRFDDEDRREVAARLREKYRERASPLLIGPQDVDMQALGYLRDLESCVPDGESLFTVLADLVEPGPERTCGMLVTETGEYAEYDCGEVVCLCRSCGREFVLVGLNEDGDAWCDVPSCCPFCEAKAAPANDGCRIREACGEGAE